MMFLGGIERGQCHEMGKRDRELNPGNSNNSVILEKEAVIWRCSVKKMFLKILPNLKETPVLESIFFYEA